MRVIDMFRTPKQREIITYLEKNHLCRVSDVSDNNNYHKHFRALLEEGVIYICGYVGYKKIPVYALCSRIGDPTRSSSIASKCACFRRCP